MRYFKFNDEYVVLYPNGNAFCTSVIYNDMVISKCCKKRLFAILFEIEESPTIWATTTTTLVNISPSHNTVIKNVTHY